jgi:ABC-2 type transport system ATP-binding protein
VGIAQAIVHDPSIVFLDEPMSGLDPIGRKEIRDLILRLNGEGKTIFMNTHILSDVEMLCHRVAILVKGRIRFEGAIDDMPTDGVGTDVVLSRMAPDAVLQMQESFETEVHGRGDRIELRVEDKRVAELLRSALEAGADVISVTPHRASLESVFLTAVSEGERAEEEGR